MWNFIVSAFNTVVFEPLFNFLVIILNVIPGHSLGIAIILVTIIVRLVLFPHSQKSIQSQKKLMELRPQLKAIEAKYKDDRQRRAQEQLEFYRKHKINPFGALLFPLFIQLPILIGLYRIFLVSFQDREEVQSLLYSQVSVVDSISTTFLGINLAESSVILAAVAALMQFLHARSMNSNKPKPSAKSTKDDKPDFQQSLTFSMMYVLPIVVFFFGAGIPGVIDGFPAGVSLYWAVSALFSYGQYRLNDRKNSKAQDDTEDQESPSQDKDASESSPTTPSGKNSKKQKQGKKPKNKKKQRRKKK